MHFSLNGVPASHLSCLVDITYTASKIICQTRVPWIITIILLFCCMLILYSISLNFNNIPFYSQPTEPQHRCLACPRSDLMISVPSNKHSVFSVFLWGSLILSNYWTKRIVWCPLWPLLLSAFKNQAEENKTKTSQKPTFISICFNS